jgi:hypothetical protein
MNIKMIWNKTLGVMSDLFDTVFTAIDAIASLFDGIDIDD